MAGQIENTFARTDEPIHLPFGLIAWRSAFVTDDASVDLTVQCPSNLGRELMMQHMYSWTCTCGCVLSINRSEWVLALLFLPSLLFARYKCSECSCKQTCFVRVLLLYYKGGSFSSFLPFALFLFRSLWRFFFLRIRCLITNASQVTTSAATDHRNINGWRRHKQEDGCNNSTRGAIAPTALFSTVLCCELCTVLSTRLSSSTGGSVRLLFICSCVRVLVVCVLPPSPSSSTCALRW